MTTKQVKFTDADNIPTGGIGIFENDKLVYIICGHCGDILEPEDIDSYTAYDFWVNIEEAIRGDN